MYFMTKTRLRSKNITNYYWIYGIEKNINRYISLWIIRIELEFKLF